MRKEKGSWQKGWWVDGRAEKQKREEKEPRDRQGREEAVKTGR